MDLTANVGLSVESLVLVVGYITLLYYLLNWSWKCWCGFKVYIQSEFWQVDLRAYGQWAGKIILSDSFIANTIVLCGKVNILLSPLQWNFE